jgi:hypothetical protein
MSDNRAPERPLPERIDGLEAEISCLEYKKRGIEIAIESRRQTLARLKTNAAKEGLGHARTKNCGA